VRMLYLHRLAPIRSIRVTIYAGGSRRKLIFAEMATAVSAVVGPGSQRVSYPIHRVRLHIYLRPGATHNADRRGTSSEVDAGSRETPTGG
jgi:hypothetical protein